MTTFRSAPSLTVSTRESPLYQALNGGLTDRLFLLGHADGLTLNSPYRVDNMRDALDAMNADADSPLVKALLEAYLAGARDLWVMAVAPMSEYEEDLDNRDIAYYEQYRDRLNVAYDILEFYDLVELLVPVDAPFNVPVDFLTPLVDHCVKSYTRSEGVVALGFLGTRGVISDAAVTAMINDGRLGSYGDAGKFVSVFIGDGNYNLREMPVNHTSSAVTAVAAQISQLAYDRGITYRKLRNISHMIGKDLSKTQINALAEAGLNVVGRNIRGRRGLPFNVVPFTDNTLATAGSDFWSLTQMRLVSHIVNEARMIGNRSLGTIGFGLFRDELNKYLVSLVGRSAIREFTLQVNRHPNELSKVFVEITVKPFFGVRELTAEIVVGPGA